MSQDNEDELLTGAEVAKACRVSDETVRRWADLGRLPHITLPSGHRRYRRSAVDAFLAPTAAEG